MYIQLKVSINTKNKADTMTQTEFITECNKYSVHPADALESELIQEALTCRNDKEVKRILNNL